MKPTGYRRAWHERRFFHIGGSSNRAKDLEVKSSVSCVPSRNTGQGAYCHDKSKPKKGGGEGKPSSRNFCEEKRVKVR